MLAAILSLFLFVQDVEIKKVIDGSLVPIPTGVTPDNKELEKLKWIHYQVGEFNILSLDDKQGLYLSQNIERMKKWAIERWGINNFHYSRPAVVVCVPNKEMMQKLFDLDSAYSEVRKKDGKIETSILWLVLDSQPAHIIPNSLTYVTLEEFKQQANFDMPFFSIRGMSILNMTIDQIKSSLMNSGKKFTASDLIKMDEKKYLSLSSEDKKAYDYQSAILVLMMRKEYGQNKFLTFLKSGQISDLGFSSEDQLDEIYNRFLINLQADISKNVIPNNYLQIDRVER